MSNDKVKESCILSTSDWILIQELEEWSIRRENKQCSVFLLRILEFLLKYDQPRIFYLLYIQIVKH